MPLVAMRESAQNGVFAADRNRRRSPRFGCNGCAKMICLPSDGIPLLGTIRNLSLGGCFVETALQLPCGAQTEILARVDSASFRALAEVRAVRERFGICMQFVRLSARGEELLSELVSHLAMAQVTNAEATLTQEFRPELPRQRPTLPKTENFPALRTLLPVSEEVLPVENQEAVRIKTPVLINPLDLFV